LKIVILGAGQVGSTLAESLVSEQNDITVVDQQPARLKELQDKFDLRSVIGSAAHPSTLVDAGLEDADMLVAVTQSDETNLVACKIAAKLFNTPTKIARVRSRSIVARPELLADDGFAVDYAISPEDIVTEYITRLIDFPEALQVIDFANGRVTMVAVRAVEGGLEVRRLRQVVSPEGSLSEEIEAIRLDGLDPDRFEAEAAGAGLVARERIEIPPTAEHVGSVVCVLETGR